MDWLEPPRALEDQPTPSLEELNHIYGGIGGIPVRSIEHAQSPNEVRLRGVALAGHALAGVWTERRASRPSCADGL